VCVNCTTCCTSDSAELLVMTIQLSTMRARHTSTRALLPVRFQFEIIICDSIARSRSVHVDARAQAVGTDRQSH
jgi:hypothetical protein